jgi:hypothetical protein
MASAIAIAYAMTSNEPQPVAYTTHAVLIAATAARSWSPKRGGSRLSIVITIAFAMLHAANSATSSHSGVAAMRCARCNHGIARIAAGPDAKTRRDAPISRQEPLILLTEDLSGPAADNLTKGAA